MLIPHSQVDAARTNWRQQTRNKRAEYGLKPTDMPWTGRDDVVLRGCTAQADQENFIHELLNLRWSRQCKSRNLSVSGPVPTDIFTDLRHSITHQLGSGSGVLMSGSDFYWHWADRTLCPYEYLRLQGWPDKLRLEDLCKPIDRARTAKRPRTDVRALATKTIDLAGNMMCIPDLAAVWYSALLSCDDGTFNKPAPSPVQCQQLLSDNNPSSHTVPLLDPHDMSLEEISIAFGTSASSDEV